MKVWFRWIFLFKQVNDLRFPAVNCFASMHPMVPSAEVGRGFPWHEAWEYRPRCQYVKTLKRDLRKGAKNKGIPWQVMDKLRADEWALPVFFRYSSFRWLLVECIDQSCFIVVLLGEGLILLHVQIRSRYFGVLSFSDHVGPIWGYPWKWRPMSQQFWDTYGQLCTSRLVLESISEVFCLDKSLMRPKIRRLLWTNKSFLHVHLGLS